MWTYIEVTSVAVYEAPLDAISSLATPRVLTRLGPHGDTAPLAASSGRPSPGWLPGRGE